VGLAELRPALGSRTLKATGAAVAAVGILVAFSAPHAEPTGVALPDTVDVSDSLVFADPAAPHTAPLARKAFGRIGFVAQPGRSARTTDPRSATLVRASRSANYSRAGLPGLGMMSDNAIAVINEVHASFPQLHDIGGYRAGDPGDHGTGHAVDIMCGRADGDALAAHLQTMAGTLHIKYLIWRQRIWYPGSGVWKPMEDRGSITANHYDHVHVSVY
jgi:hypothetical protein